MLKRGVDKNAAAIVCSTIAAVDDLLDLRTENLDVYRNVASGLLVARRSDRFWTRLWIELVIEQVLRTSPKKGGGLTEGRALTEQQCLIWLSSTPRVPNEQHHAIAERS